MLRRHIAPVLIGLLLSAGFAAAQDADGVGTDVLRLQDGRLLVGRLLAFDGAVFTFQTTDGRVDYRRDQVAGLLVGSSGAPVEPPTVPGSLEDVPTPDLGITGRWHSVVWGWLELKQIGARVVGLYHVDAGQIDGYIVGDTIYFVWWEKVDRGLPYAATTPSERGDGFFRINADQTELAGAWRYEREYAARQAPARDWVAVPRGELEQATGYVPPPFAPPPGAWNWPGAVPPPAP